MYASKEGTLLFYKLTLHFDGVAPLGQTSVLSLGYCSEIRLFCLLPET